MLVKVGRLISLYFIIIIVIHIKCRDVQGFLNLYLMLMYDGLKYWCSSQYSKTPFLFVLGQILKLISSIPKTNSAFCLKTSYFMNK